MSVLEAGNVFDTFYFNGLVLFYFFDTIGP